MVADSMGIFSYWQVDMYSGPGTNSSEDTFSWLNLYFYNFLIPFIIEILMIKRLLGYGIYLNNLNKYVISTRTSRPKLTSYFISLIKLPHCYSTTYDLS